MLDGIVFNKLVTGYILQNKGLLFIYIIVVIFTWPTEAILLSRKYSDLVSSLKKKVSFEQIFDVKNNIAQGNIFGVSIVILIIWVLLIIFYRTKHSLEEKIFPSYTSYTRDLLVMNVLSSTGNDYKDIKSGEYITTIVELSSVFLHLIQLLSNKFLPLFIGIIIISIYYLFLNPLLGTTSLILSFIRIFNNYYEGMKYAQTCAIRDKTYFSMNEHFNDTFNNAMNIHLNSAMEQEEEKNRKLSDRYEDEQEDEMRMKKEITWKSNIITIFCFLCVILLSYYLYGKKYITFPILLTIAFIEIKLIGSFVEFDSVSLHFFQKLGTIIAADDFLKNIFKQNEEVEKNKCNMKNGSIVIKNMSFRYDNNSPYIFENMNLNVKSGSKIGLVGRSGSGKSTLMKLLIKLHKHTKGTIKIGNCNIDDINNEKIRKDVIYINQKTLLQNDTVMKNILYGNDTISEREVKDYMKNYELDEIYSGLDKGINSSVGVNGSLLSLGMQKVTILLRGIFKEGIIYIFDEPLAGLDKKTRVKVIKMINNISRDKTILVVTHDPEILSHLDHVYKLDQIHTPSK
jgi:ABC-type multidrug transport system fused ATPase/permease subunit